MEAPDPDRPKPELSAFPPKLASSDSISIGPMSYPPRLRTLMVMLQLTQQCPRAADSPAYWSLLICRVPDSHLP